MTVRRFTEGLLAFARKRHMDRELEQEIRAHLELAERDARAAGLSAEEARREARIHFGGIQQMKEEHRERRSFPWIENLLRDVRYGTASLLRAPGFTAVAIGVLALGIGANVAMFSIVDAVLLKPLPFPEPDRIVSVWEAPRPGVSNSTSVPDFQDWRRLTPVFEALSAEKGISAALDEKDGPIKLTGKAVTADYFRVFPTGVRMGRTFTPEEDRPGAPRVIVLSFAAWQNSFGSDPEILQRKVVLDGEAHQVIGVLRPGAFDRDDTKFWKPLIFTPDQQVRNLHWLTVYGRLQRDATLAQARERLHSIYAALLETKPIDDRAGTVEVQPLAKLMVGPGLERSISVAFGAVFLVLLIACANLATLLLARGATRRREMAVRAALGAGRGRLVAQLLTESVILCLLGGAAGLVVATLFLRMAAPVLADSLPFTADVTLDLPVLLFAGAIASGVGLVAGTLPALQASFGDVAVWLNRAARGYSGSHTRGRRIIVVGEVALSLILVCGAMLLLESLLKLQKLDTGVRMDNVITASIDLPAAAYPTPEKAAAFYETLSQRLGAAPGVAAAGLSTHLPLQWIGNGEGIQVAGVESFVRVRFKRVDPGYFQTLGIPVLAGRGITSRDREGSPRVIVINQALASRLADAAGMPDAIGKVVRISYPGYIQMREFFPEVQIAGMIRNERVASPGSPDPPVAYVPLAQAPSPGIKLLVRGQSKASVMPAIREAVRQTDPTLPLGEVATMEQVWERTLSGSSRPAGLIGAFALVAVLLTAIGLYGVLSHTVTQQRREIGIRMALGARSMDVLSQVLRSALSVIAVGLALGMVGAFAVTRVMKSLLFEVDPVDPLVFTLACVAMALVGLLAAFVPANRAAHVDPVTTLRDEG